MNDRMINKLENEKRLMELNPINTLIKAGFKDDSVLCDIGAGTGVFTFPASNISNNKIYALDISDKMIDILSSRKIDKKTENVIIRKVESSTLPVDDNSCDMVSLVTVLHEIGEKELMINEIKRILKTEGRVIVIDFHKKETSMGPPMNIRISEDDICLFFNNKGFKTVDKILQGDNLYGLVFQI